MPEKLYFQPEKKIKKVGEKIKNGRENCQKSAKNWARKPIFAREKNENTAKNRLLAHFGVSRPKKKTLPRPLPGGEDQVVAIYYIFECHESTKVYILCQHCINMEI